MFTIRYKDCFIHGYFDRDECKVCGALWGTFKSMHAAKCAITRHGGQQ